MPRLAIQWTLSASRGYATFECAGNNNYVARSVQGICSSTGHKSDPTHSERGYYNVNSGGTITEGDYNSLSPTARQALDNAGYRPVGEVTTNQIGNIQAEIATMSANAQAAAEAVDAENLAEWQAALDAAEAAAEEEEEGAKKKKEEDGKQRKPQRQPQQPRTDKETTICMQRVENARE